MSRENMERAALELRLTHPIDNFDSRTASTITIVDRTSLKTVAVFELTEKDFHNLMASRNVDELDGVAYLAQPSDLAKLRQRRVSINRTLPRLPYRSDQLTRVRTWAEEAARCMGADESRVSASSTGIWTVTILMYLAPDAQDPELVEAFQLRQTRILESFNLRGLGVEEVGQ